MTGKFSPTQDLFSAKAKGVTILLLFIVTTVVYIVMLAVTIPTLMEFSGGKKILDMMPGGYDMAYVADLMGSLSSEGRWYYLTRQLPLDFLYPGLFAITYPLVFIYFLRKLNRQTSTWRVIAILPVIAGAADYMENFCFIALIRSFPAVSENLVKLASTLSVLKATTTTIFFLSLTILLIVVLVDRLRQARLA